MRPSKGYPVVLALLLAGASTPASADNLIAGETPWERPNDAPQITEVDRPATWYTEALHGVSRPYPHSLRFLEDQGNWNTPFNRPGMTGRYDIRGWHRK